MSSNSVRRSAVTLSVAVALTGLASGGNATAADAGSASQAQDGGPSVLNEIVVTAQRRKERVTDVPISVTVADQAQLEREQVHSVSDLAQIAPSLEMNAGQGTNVGGGGIIRGIGTETFGAGAQAAVGIVVDQVPQGNINVSDLFDIARVEVLEGPQGTLFGLTTSAGVINITTNAPNPRRTSFMARTDLSHAGTAGSEYGQQVVQGVANLPISSDSAVRIAAQTNQRQGVDRNVDTGNLTRSHDYAARARYLWKPDDKLTLNLIGDFSNTRSDGTDFFTFISNGSSTVQDVPDLATLMARCGVTVGVGNPDYCFNKPITMDEKVFGTSLEADYDFGPATLSSISSYRGDDFNQNLQSILRADPLPISIGNAPQIKRTRLFTQELRLFSPSSSRLEYTVGAFYSHFTDVEQPRLSTNILPGKTATSPSRTILNPRGLINITEDSIAGFGQATYHVTSAFRVIGGTRLTRDKLSYSQLAPVSSAEETSTRVSYRAGLQYDLSRDTMAYATSSRGFKGGQISVSSNSTAPPQIIRPEISKSYEVGLKSTLFRAWVINMNAFHEKIEDYQGQQCTTTSASGLFNCQQVNLPYVLTRGAEIDLFGGPLEGISLNTGFIYADATYSPGLIGKDGTNLGGKQIAFSPRYKFTLSSEYEHPLSSEINGFLAVDTVWKSRVSYQLSSQPEETFRPHWIMGARLGVRDADDRYSAAIFVRNLFNVHEPVTLQQPLANIFPSAVGGFYGPKSFRQVGLSFQANF